MDQKIHVLVFGSNEILLSSEEYKDLTTALNEYTRIHGSEFGFMGWLLNGK